MSTLDRIARGYTVVRDARPATPNPSGLGAEVGKAIVDIVAVCVVDEHVDASGQAVRRAQERSSDGSIDDRTFAECCGRAQSISTTHECCSGHARLNLRRMKPRNLACNR